MTLVRAAALSASLTAMLAPAASANGRFPASVGVHFDQSGQTLLLAATFGLLISRDGGESFSWICEQAIGYGGTFDPDFAIGHDGAFYATTFDGLRRSDDGGCSWETVALGDLPTSTWAEEVAVAGSGHVWATTATTAQPNDVFVDRGDGAGFASTGLATTTGWWKSIAIAPSDPGRVYVTGYQVSGAGGMQPVVHLRRTDDDGESWVTLPTDGFALGAEPELRVASVSPASPATVFVISTGAATPSGDLLYRSEDAGESWTQVLQTSDVITSVVTLADGRVWVATIGDGVHTSSSNGSAGSFSPVPSPPRTACMSVSPAGELYACGANWEPDNFALGRSGDGTSWTAVTRFQDLRGPLSCPSSTPQVQICTAQVWPGICSQFGLCGGPGDGGTTADGGTKLRPSEGCGCSSAGATALLLPLFGFRRRRKTGARPS